MKKILSLITVCLLLFTSCSNTSVQDEREPDELELLLNDKYTCEKINNPDISLPSGMVMDKNQLILCNSGNNNLLKLDQNGEVLKVIGSLGNEPGAFMTPKSIFKSNNHFCVLDSRNNRIQIFDDAFNVIDQVELSEIELDQDAIYTDAVSLNNSYYVASDSVVKKTSKLSIIRDGVQILSQKNFFGFLYCDDNRVYAMDSLELYFNIKDKEGAKSGINSLYTVDENGEFTKLFDMPYKYTPTDFIITDNALYVLSSLFGRFDKFDLSGNYIETIAQFDSLSVESYLTMTDDMNFYVTDTKKNTFYYIHQ